MKKANNLIFSQIYLYYDVILPSMVIKPLNPLEELGSEERTALTSLLGNSSDAEKEQRVQQLTEWLLYGMS